MDESFTYPELNGLRAPPFIVSDDDRQAHDVRPRNVAIGDRAFASSILQNNFHAMYRATRLEIVLHGFSFLCCNGLCKQRSMSFSCLHGLWSFELGLAILKRAEARASTLRHKLWSVNSLGQWSWNF